MNFPTQYDSVRRALRLFAFAVALPALSGRAAPMPAAAGPDPTQPRERISIDGGWRFHLGDAPGSDWRLSYDVRPKVSGVDDAKAADTEPTAGVAVSDAGARVLKAWILPTGNAFIADPAKRYARPAGDPGARVPYVQAGFDDRSWQRVDLPHDWAIAGPFIEKGPGGGMGRLPTAGIGWYRRKLDIPRADAGRRIFLDVDGAMSYAEVWLNGHLVGGWPYGYASWRVDLTPYVVPGGVNQLAIRLDNPPDSSRWYPGAGLYRNVWLVVTDPVHVAHWGTTVTTPEVSPQRASVALRVAIDNDSSAPAEVTVASSVYPIDGHGVIDGQAVAHLAPASLNVPAHGQASVEGNTVVSHPRLWGPPPGQKPNRYVAVTTVSRDGRVVDRYQTRFGIRAIRFDPNRGLFVNGEHVPIRGVNRHDDLGALGTAFNLRAAQRQLEELQAMGCNALRMSHNPPAPELLELADRMGFLVMDEIFDCWYRQKNPLDFHLIFRDWHEQDLRAMLRRDRNHPSVFLWSVGNEVGEQYTGKAGAAVARELCNIVHQEDPTRPATASMNFAKSNMPFPAALDVISLNYQGEGIRDTPFFAGTKAIHTPPQYGAFHAKFPDKMILSSETASAFSTRGVYLFPVTDQISAPVRDGSGGDSAHQLVSAYGLYAVDFGSSPDKVFRALDQHPYVAGEFVWTGWDYLGEPTPYYSARSSYCGLIDLAGFPKDSYFLYQARWRPDLPMAHILPSWTWPDRVGKITPVHVFTSGDSGELFLNGRSLGRRVKGPFQYRLRWDEVRYEPGVLKVVTYKAGRVWATDEVRTAGAAAKLVVSPDRTVIRDDGRDLSFVTVRVEDARGTLVPDADNPLEFSVTGPGEIVATDNGDPRSFVPFPSHQRPAFNGLCLVIVRSIPGHPGPIVVRASGAGLQDGTATVSAEASAR